MCLGFFDTVDMSHLRVARVVRVVRLMRTMRLVRLVRFIRALRMLVHSIATTLKSLVWAIILLLMIFYGFAIAFTQTIIDDLGNNKEWFGGPLREHWGTLPRAMYTMFQSLTNGLNW